jgi:hypothetical protein
VSNLLAEHRFHRFPSLFPISVNFGDKLQLTETCSPNPLRQFRRKRTPEQVGWIRAAQEKTYLIENRSSSVFYKTDLLFVLFTGYDVHFAEWLNLQVWSQFTGQTFDFQHRYTETFTDRKMLKCADDQTQAFCKLEVLIARLKNDLLGRGSFSLLMAAV